MEGGREKEREKISMCERRMDRLLLTHPQLEAWPVTQACALKGNPARDRGVVGTKPSVLSHTSEGMCSSFASCHSKEMETGVRSP